MEENLKKGIIKLLDKYYDPDNTDWHDEVDNLVDELCELVGYNNSDEEKENYN
jgi:hypothetical protein